MPSLTTSLKVKDLVHIFFMLSGRHGFNFDVAFCSFFCFVFIFIFLLFLGYFLILYMYIFLFPGISQHIYVYLVIVNFFRV